jgi:multidrug efflux pump subunit AcrA (membrane-fusion protein)
MGKGKKTLIIILILLAVCGLVGFGIYNASRTEDSSGIPRNATPVQFEHAHRQTITSRVSAKGGVELLDRTTVYPGAQAKIEWIHVRTGDEVNEGDLLITYDPKTLEAYKDQLAEAELGLRSAQLALAAAQIPPTRTELMQAEAQISQAEAQVRQAESQINQARAQVLQSQKVIIDIESQARQIELNREQLKNNLQTAEKRAADTRTLFVMGITAQMELDGADEAVNGLKGQLELLELQLETVLNGLPMAESNVLLAESGVLMAEQSLRLAEESVPLAEAQYNSLRNRLTDARTQNQIQSLELNIEQMELRIGMIQKNIDDFKQAEYSPISGTVLTVYAAEGDMAVTGRPLLELADISNRNLIIRINVPESDAKNIGVGQYAEIKGAAFGSRSYDGHISKIHPLAERKPVGNSMETVLTVEITPDDDEINLRAGYSIDTVILTGVQENALVVPLMSTLSNPEGGHFVYIMADDYTVQRRDIRLGEYTGLYVQAEGITETERIILNPSNQIREGMYVRPIAGRAE